MRSSLRDVEVPKTFVPFKVEVVIESPAELASFWARVNMHNDTLAAAASKKAAEGRLGPWKPDFVRLLSVANCPGKKELYKLLTAKMKETGIVRR